MTFIILKVTKNCLFDIGLDTASLSGALPELLIIGVPAALNGTACVDTPPVGNCTQRTYELTPTECDPSVCICAQGQMSGGASVFLQFVWDEVILSVFDQLQLDKGEVSITGFR
jgi:hypothetical protein